MEPEQEPLVTFFEGNIIDLTDFPGLSKQKISASDWKKIKMGQLFSAIEKWRVKVISLEYHKHPTILKEINHIEFPVLKQIDFRRNEIESVEGFARIWLPQLRKVSFSRNSIINIQSLRKCNWHIHQLYFYSNKIFECQHLPEFKLEKVDELFLGFLSDRQFNDIRVLLKLEMKPEGSFEIGIGHGRIDQKSTEKAIKQKCPDCTLGR